MKTCISILIALLLLGCKGKQPSNSNINSADYAWINTLKELPMKNDSLINVYFKYNQIINGYEVTGRWMPFEPHSETGYLIMNFRDTINGNSFQYVNTEKYNSYDTDNILANEGNNSLNSLKYNYQMNIECSRKPASGFVGGGVKQLIFSDMKNSQVKDNWNRVSTVWNDVYTNNGIIHILSPQHSFGFDEFIYVFNNYGNEYKK